MTDNTDPTGPLPLAEVHTPTLDEWRCDGHRRAEQGWVNWVDPDQQYRVGVEVVDLPVPDEDRVAVAFEVVLWDIAGDESVTDDQRLRETIYNGRLAAYAAELVATHAGAFADGWDKGLAPRPKDVEP